MRAIGMDVAASLRVFKRAPGLAASVALTIGLGVGASLAIFGLLHDTLVGQSPFREPGGLVSIENTGRYYFGGRMSDGLASGFLSGPDFADIEDQTRTLSEVGAVARFSGVMEGGDRPRPVWRTLVSPRLLPLLGAHPRLGRLLEPGDFRPGATPAAVLTDSMWRRHFGSDPAAVGRVIRLDNQVFTVVGVVPDAVLRFLAQPEGLLDRVQDRQVITPLVASMAGGEVGLFKYLERQRDAPFFPIVVGRLAPGRTPEEAASEATVIAGRLAAAHPETNARRGLRVTPLDAWRTTKVRGTTLMLLAASLLVFLVASSNAAGLVLAESVSHEAETAVRQALGAGSTALVRLEFLRSLALALPGGVLAVLLAGLTLLLVDRTLADGSGTILRALFVSRVMLAGVVVTVAAGLIAGAGAAWSLRRRRVVDALKEAGPTVSAGRWRQLAARGFVALQVAAATALVLGAGLMLRSVWNIVTVDLGFDVRHSLAVHVRLPPDRYPKGENQRTFLKQALRRIRALPGVAAAGVGITAPLTGTSSSASGVEVELPSGERRTPERLNVQLVMPGYLEALDVKLVRGRWFTDRDYESGQALLVDQAFCRKYLSGADPLQTRVRLERELVPIVGVVADVRRDGPLSEPVDMVYVMEKSEGPAPWFFLVVRAAGNPAALGPAVVRELAAMDPAVAIEDPQTVSELFGNTFATRRRLLLLLGSAATIVLLLTAFSLVSALGQFVAVRRREIAIRLALGGTARHVAGRLGRHVAVAMGIGLAAGAGGGLLLARTLSAELFGVSPADSATFLEAVASVALLAILASLGPLWRASRIDPARSLRAE